MDLSDSLDSLVALGIVGILIAVPLVVLSVLIAISPLMCWWNLSKLRREFREFRNTMVRQLEAISQGEVATGGAYRAEPAFEVAHAGETEPADGIAPAGETAPADGTAPAE